MHSIRTLCVPAVAAAVALAGFHASLHAQMPSLSGGPMLSCSGLPCVEATTGNGIPLKMLVDTGNANSVLDLTKAKALGLELKPVNGPDGKPYPGYSVAKIKDVRVGIAVLGDLQVLVVDLQPDLKKGDWPSADGALAYTAFKDRILRMDYKEQRVGISEVLKTDVPCPDFCGAITTPTFGKHGPPIVVTTGFLVNKKPLTVQIDTLYSGTMLIYPTSVEKFGLGDQQSSTKKLLFPFTDGGVEMIEGTAGTESFGTVILKQNAPLYFATPEVHAPDGMFDGTVGHELFAGRVLTLDFHAHHCWMS